MKKIIWIWVILLSITSCTEIIQLDLPNNQSEIIVEASMATDNEIRVMLSRSVSLSDSNTFPLLTDAVVSISDENNNTETLSETEPGVYQSITTKGAEGKRYFLDILIGNKPLSAISTMPNNVNFGELVVEKGSIFGPIGGSTNETDFYEVKVLFADPTEEVNYYRFVEFVNNEKQREYIYDDRLNNGKDVEIALFRFNRFLKKEDVIRIEMQNITKEFYLYLTSLNDLRNSARSGSTPANPVSNILGTTLGYFNTYTTQSKEFVIE
jgi:hypothetical protein